jgi:hypothetical protein
LLLGASTVCAGVSTVPAVVSRLEAARDAAWDRRARRAFATLELPAVTQPGEAPGPGLHVAIGPDGVFFDYRGAFAALGPARRRRALETIPALWRDAMLNPDRAPMRFDRSGSLDIGQREIGDEFLRLYQEAVRVASNEDEPAPPIYVFVDRRLGVEQVRAVTYRISFTAFVLQGPDGLVLHSPHGPCSCGQGAGPTFAVTPEATAFVVRRSEERAFDLDRRLPSARGSSPMTLVARVSREGVDGGLETLRRVLLRGRCAARPARPATTPGDLATQLTAALHHDGSWVTARVPRDALFDDYARLDFVARDVMRADCDGDAPRRSPP